MCRLSRANVQGITSKSDVYGLFALLADTVTDPSINPL